ncbi:MAG: MFS transporter [Deltaproteobacteria bacterium]|nr:MFS transporter [Deltaproteobacteria bacterium]
MRKVLNTTVIVSALGYFVDIYDLLLFSIVRVASLKDLGIADEHILENGVFLLNCQMTGMLVGGIFWGILGDKKGRLSVLFGSIFLYSIANILNGFVHTVEMYAVLRFFAGLGLAGELGAAITLVAEILPKENRGYGTAIVAGVGIMGAVVAGLVGDIFHWRTAYFIGGGLGLLLLVMRISMFESGMYKSLQTQNVKKGDLWMLIGDRKRLLKYIACILVGVPLWFVVGILITLSPELGEALQVQGPVSALKAVMYSYFALSLGDILSGFLSQYFKTRKKVLFVFLGLTYFFVLAYVFSSGLSVQSFYWLCFALGFGAGYWAVFMTVAAEQFGTNLRATVATTAPNFVRGAVVPMTLGFQILSHYISLPMAALAVGTIVIALAVISTAYLSETHAKDLDYLEH